MASKWVNAMLWTLVSVNLVTLVLGGLITWLGYAIPIRLKQFGLSPEITQMAGFASLLVACLGLGGLNYSSHYALNAYGLSCAIFIILLLFGALPDQFQRAIYTPSTSAPSSGVGGPQEHRHINNNQQQQQQQQQHQRATTAATPTLSSSTAAAFNGSAGSATSHRLKETGQPLGANLILELVYIALLLVLSVLLAASLMFAQHLRRRELEREEADEEEELTVVDCCDQELGLFAQRNSGELAQAASRRRLLPRPTTDWGCTCNERVAPGGGGLSMTNSGQAAAAALKPPNLLRANKELSRYEPAEEDKIQFMQKMVLGVGGGPCAPMSAAKSRVDAVRLASKSTTPTRWDCRPEETAFPRLAAADELPGPHRLASKSMANLAPDNDQQEFERHTAAACSLGPLVAKGLFYADSQAADDFAAAASRPGRYEAGPESRSFGGPEHRTHRLRYEEDDQRARTLDGQCCCCDWPAQACQPSKAAAALAVKLNPTTAANQALFGHDHHYRQQQHHHHHHHQSHQHHQHHQSRHNPHGRAPPSPSTMPNKFSLSSVYAIRSTPANQTSSRTLDSARRKHKQSKLFSGSVMAMTASAAAALLGGVALDPDAIGHEHSAGLANSSAMDDGLDFGDALIEHHADHARCNGLDHVGPLAADCPPSSSNYATLDRQHH